MLSNELRFRVEEILNNVVDINGYKFQECLISVPKDITIGCYIDLSCMKDVEVGDYYKTNKAYLTSLEDPAEGKREKELYYRIDYVSESDEEEYNEWKETKVRLNALMIKGKNSVLTENGPMKISFFPIKALVKNEFGNKFSILVMGFYNRAKMLDDAPNTFYADIYGELSRRRSDKPCFIILKEMEIRKEV